MRNIAPEEFSRQVLQSDVPVLLAFRANWCEASQQLTPIIDSVIEGYQGRVEAVVVDLGDESPRANRITKRLKVNRLPAVLLFNEGRVKDLMGGLPSVEDVTDMVERQLQPVMSVGEHNFKQEVLESKVPVLVHFHASTCEQSMALLDSVDSLAERFAERARVVRVEVDPFNAALCARYGAVRFPMVGTFQDGKMRDYILGAGEEDFTVEDGLARRRADYFAEMLEQFV